MTDLVFEDPPKKARRSEHWDLLLALKEHPTTDTFSGFARVKTDLEEKAANSLAGAMRTAASGLGEGWEIVVRLVPETGKHGVWARYVPTASDEPPPDKLAEAHAEARNLIAAAHVEPDFPDFDRATEPDSIPAGAGG